MKWAPERLDRFRLGHFFLLALTYSLFFIVFAVTIYREHLGVIPALVLSAVFFHPYFPALRISNVLLAVAAYCCWDRDGNREPITLGGAL